jgi:hypothetical protein
MGQSVVPDDTLYLSRLASGLRSSQSLRSPLRKIRFYTFAYSLPFGLNSHWEENDQVTRDPFGKSRNSFGRVVILEEW